MPTELHLRKAGKLHSNAVNGLMRIVAGVGSGRFGYVTPGWKKRGDARFHRSIQSSSVIVLVKRCCGQSSKFVVDEQKRMFQMGFTDRHTLI